MEQCKSSYLPSPKRSPLPLTVKTPQSKKQKLNLPSPLTNHARTTTPNRKYSNNRNILPPPNKPLPPPPPTPSKMDIKAMDTYIRKHRQDSWDALIRDSIVDNSSTDEYDDIETETEQKSAPNKAKHQDDNDDNDLSIDHDMIIALVNSGSGARKGWILAAELRQYDCIVYHIRDLSVSETIRIQLGQQLHTYKNKCLVLICGGDGSNAWAASIIDKCINTLPHSIPFPPMCVFPMGTGNDLSRCLGWGSLEPNHKNLLQCVSDIHFASKITKRWSDLDRWRITYTFDDIIEPIISNKHNGNKIHESKYDIKPPAQFYRQQQPSSAIYKHIESYDPPLNTTFICYLSIGYDALVAYNFERERRAHPERFNNQLKNQVMYVKHGFSEFFKPSEPITDFVDVYIDGDKVSLPDNCRSLKLININSAMNGVFFWGSGKSRDYEYQQESVPRLDDGKIEVMATRGVHDMIQHRVNVSHAQRISQCNDITIRFKAIPKNGVALQIDGEAWMMKRHCTLRVQLHDKIPVVIGYNQPRGVRPWLMASLDDAHIVKAKEAFREKWKRKYTQNEAKVFVHPPYISEADKANKDGLNNSLMSLFNINNILKPNSPRSQNNVDLFEKIGGLLKRKSGSEEKNVETPRSDDDAVDEVDFPQYIKNNPSILKDKNSILQSSVFDAKRKHNDGLFLDRFTWWKVTRAKNYDKAIDAETATDAISNHEHIEMRKTRSFASLPGKGRSASLF